MRESLPDLLRAFGFEVEPFSSAEEFLALGGVKRTGRPAFDVAMPLSTEPPQSRHPT